MLQVPYFAVHSQLSGHFRSPGVIRVNKNDQQISIKLYSLPIFILVRESVFCQWAIQLAVLLTTTDMRMRENYVTLGILIAIMWISVLLR